MNLNFNNNTVIGQSRKNVIKSAGKEKKLL
jgi:hypothetical protein